MGSYRMVHLDQDDLTIPELSQTETQSQSQHSSYDSIPAPPYSITPEHEDFSPPAALNADNLSQLEQAHKEDDEVASRGPCSDPSSSQSTLIDLNFANNLDSGANLDETSIAQRADPAERYTFLDWQLDLGRCFIQRFYLPSYLKEVRERYPILFAFPHKVELLSAFFPKSNPITDEMGSNMLPTGRKSLKAGFDTSIYLRSKNLWPDRPIFCYYVLSGTEEHVKHWRALLPGTALRKIESWTMVSALLFTRLSNPGPQAEFDKLSTLFFKGAEIEDSAIARATPNPAVFQMTTENALARRVCDELLAYGPATIYLTDILQNHAIEDAYREHRVYQKLTVKRNPNYDALMKYLDECEHRRANGLNHRMNFNKARYTNDNTHGTGNVGTPDGTATPTSTTSVSNAVPAATNSGGSTSDAPAATTTDDTSSTDASAVADSGTSTSNAIPVATNGGGSTSDAPAAITTDGTSSMDASAVADSGTSTSNVVSASTSPVAGTVAPIFEDSSITSMQNSAENQLDGTNKEPKNEKSQRKTNTKKRNGSVDSSSSRTSSRALSGSRSPLQKVMTESSTRGDDIESATKNNSKSVVASETQTPLSGATRMKESSVKGVAKSHASANIILSGSAFATDVTLLKEKADEQNQWEEVKTRKPKSKPAASNNRSHMGYKGPQNAGQNQRAQGTNAAASFAKTKALNAQNSDPKFAEQKTTFASVVKGVQPLLDKTLTQAKPVSSDVGSDSKQGQVDNSKEVIEPASHGSGSYKPDVPDSPEIECKYPENLDNPIQPAQEPKPTQKTKVLTILAKPALDSKQGGDTKSQHGVSIQSATPKNATAEQAKVIKSAVSAYNVSPKKSVSKKAGESSSQNGKSSAQISSKKPTGSKDRESNFQNGSSSAQVSSTKNSTVVEGSLRLDQDILGKKGMHKPIDSSSETKHNMTEGTISSTGGSSKVGKTTHSTNHKPGTGSKDTTLVDLKNPAKTPVHSKVAQRPTDVNTSPVADQKTAPEVPKEIADAQHNDEALKVADDVSKLSTTVKITTPRPVVKLPPTTDTKHGAVVDPQNGKCPKEETPQVESPKPHVLNETIENSSKGTGSSPDRVSSVAEINKPIPQTSLQVTHSVAPRNVASSRHSRNNSHNNLRHGHTSGSAASSTHSHPIPYTNSMGGSGQGRDPNMAPTHFSQGHDLQTPPLQPFYDQYGNVAYFPGYRAPLGYYQSASYGHNNNFHHQQSGQPGQVLYPAQSQSILQQGHHASNGWSNSMSPSLYHGASQIPPSQMMFQGATPNNSQNYNVQGNPSSLSSNFQPLPPAPPVARGVSGENKGKSSAAAHTLDGQSGETTKEDQSSGSKSSQKKKGKNTQAPESQTTTGTEVNPSTEDAGLECLYCKTPVKLEDRTIEVCLGCTPCRNAFYCNTACLLIHAATHHLHCGKGAIVRLETDLPFHLRGLRSPIQCVTQEVLATLRPNDVQLSASMNAWKFRQRAFSMHCSPSTRQQFPGLMATWANVNLKPREMQSIGSRLDESRKLVGEYYIFRSNLTNTEDPFYNKDADVIFTVCFEPGDRRKQALKRALNSLYFTSGNLSPLWSLQSMEVAEFVYKLIQSSLDDDTFSKLTPGVADKAIVLAELNTQFQNEFCFNPGMMESNAFDFSKKWPAIDRTLCTMEVAYSILNDWKFHY
ncbi:hypothetical protein PVAG01_06025 [Phlyctema vagabunda]|uniref:MYND-type domain-containing protein n=1 Tax=Phlyctema vagabunda TaxID=108571 RepID=A0ABR4PEX3_9HELO